MNAREARSITIAAQALGGLYKQKEMNEILDAISKAADVGKSAVYICAAPYNDPIIIKRLGSLIIWYGHTMINEKVGR